MKIIPLLVCGWLLVVGQGAAFAAQPDMKIATVNLQRALNEVEEGKKAKAQLKVDFEAKQKKLEILRGEAESLGKEMEKQRLVASQQELSLKEETLKKKVQELQMQMGAFQQELATQEAQYTGRILGELKALVESMGAKEGYTFVFENSQNVVLYSPNVTDLTTRVIQEYNKKGGKH